MYTRMLAKRCPEFVILFLGSSCAIFINMTFFYVVAGLVTGTCLFYIISAIFIIPNLPKMYTHKIGETPKVNKIQIVLCLLYIASTWAAIFWKVG